MAEPEGMSDAIDVSDRTKFAMPIRNLISLIASVAVGVWAYFGIIERLNRIETDMILVNSDLVKNTEFRIKWPRGDLGSLPADAEQFMLIEHLSGEFDKLLQNIETGKVSDRIKELNVVLNERWLNPKE